MSAADIGRNHLKQYGKGQIKSIRPRDARVGEVKRVGGMFRLRRRRAAGRPPPWGRGRAGRQVVHRP